MHHEYSGCEFESRSRISFSFSQFSRLSRNENGEHYFIAHSDVFYSVIKQAHWTFIQIWPKSLLKNMFLLRAMIKQFSILQNVIKVMVVLKKGAMVNQNI